MLELHGETFPGPAVFSALNLPHDGEFLGSVPPGVSIQNADILCSGF